MTCTCPVESPAANAADVVAETLHRHHQRARRHAHGRPHLRRLDGAAQEGRLFLMSAVLDHELQVDAGRRRAAAADHRALRFLTAGSVDDGKSTLIGRLAVRQPRDPRRPARHAATPRPRGEPIDLSLLTDGLEAEREQGITIDVAYRYFATRQRKFIIADAPGHEQYTRNMVTAAAGSDAAVVLVDITKIDWRARRGGAAAADAAPRAAGTAAASAEHRVRGQQARRRRRPRRRVRRPCAKRCERFAADAGIRGGRHRAGVGAARRQRDAAAARTLVQTAPRCSQLLEQLPTTQERIDGAAGPAGAVRRPRRRRHRPPGAHAVGPHRARPGARRRRGAVASRAASTAQRARRAARRRSPSTVGERRPVGRPRARPPARRLARRLDRRAGLVARDAALSRPRSPGSTPSRRRSAAATGCATATAGCRRASARSNTGSTSTRSQPTDAHQLAVNDIGDVVVETAAAAAARAVREQSSRLAR